MRKLTEKEFCHERLGAEFVKAVSTYDTTQRLKVLIDLFLGQDVAGKKVLDVGCGLGYFSERLSQLGAEVTACDIGPGLLEVTKQRVGCPVVFADAIHLTEYFELNHFDIVVSSECIEHTPDPNEAVRQMLNVLRPGGLLSLSTPNKLWFPMVKAATLLKLRPYDGFENFSTFSSLRGTIQDANGTVLQERGLHLFPFQFGFHNLSSYCDTYWQFLRHFMINLCILAQKNVAPR